MRQMTKHGFSATNNLRTLAWVLISAIGIAAPVSSDARDPVAVRETAAAPAPARDPAGAPAAARELQRARHYRRECAARSRSRFVFLAMVLWAKDSCTNR